MRMLLRCFIAGIAGMLTGCVKDPLTGSPEIPLPSAKGVYIVNEGNFGRGNSSLSYFDLGSFQVYNDVFSAVNKRDLGDVGTGMVVRGDLGYIVVNNSNRIEVLDLRTNASVGTIDTGPGTSPRRLAFVNDTLGLVTNLYDNSISLIDLKRLGILRRLSVGPNPDGIAVASGRTFVANSGFGSGSTVSVLDVGGIETGAVPGTVTVTVGENPGSVRISPNGQVYVVCAGGYGDFNNPNDDTPAKIFIIDPNTISVVDSIYLGAHANDIAINGVDGMGYVATTDSVLRIDTRTNRKIGLFLLGAYYGAGVEEVSGDVYLADPKNYIQPGTVSVYASTGQLRTSFDVGIIPGWFAFRR